MGIIKVQGQNMALQWRSPKGGKRRKEQEAGGKKLRNKLQPIPRKECYLPFPALEVRRSVDLSRRLVVLIESSLER